LLDVNSSRRDGPKVVLSLAKQANAFWKAEGYADPSTGSGQAVGRVYGKARVLAMSKGLTPALAAGASVAHVSDVVKTERSMNVRL